MIFVPTSTSTAQFNDTAAGSNFTFVLSMQSTLSLTSPPFPKRRIKIAQGCIDKRLRPVQLCSLLPIALCLFLNSRLDNKSGIEGDNEEMTKGTQRRSESESE